MRRLVVALPLTIFLLFTAVPASAQDDELFDTPSSCLFDPGFGTGGTKIIEPADGYNIDRIAFDNEGRLYANGERVVADSYVLDRIRRYTPNGDLDTGWAGTGQLDVPGRAYATGSRTMAVGDDELRFARASYLNQFQVHRLNTDGTYPAIYADAPIVYSTYDLNGELDPVGDAFIVGDVYLASYGYAVGSTNGLSMLRRAGLRGSSFVVRHQVDTGPSNVVDVVPDGLSYLGGWSLAVSEAASYVWRTTSHEIVRLPDNGIFNGVQLTNADKLVVYGSELGDNGGIPSAAVGFVDVANATTQVVATPGLTTILHLSPDGDVVGLADDQLFVGRLDTDGHIVDVVRSTTPSQWIKAEVHEAPDGSSLIASYADYLGGKLALTRLNPPNLGPVVTSHSLSDQVVRLYRAYFLRDPDAAGLQYWMRERAGGISIDDMSAVFSGSAEFTNRYGELADADFVDLVYQNALKRSADPDGRAYWLGQLSGGALTRGELMTAFSEGEESIRRTSTVGPHRAELGQVHRLYRAYLLREPDADGLCYWARLIAGGLPLTGVSEAFAASAEFQGRYGSLTSRQFVQQIYLNVLGRPGDQPGVDYWTSLIEGGTVQRGEVVTEFSESQENIMRTGTLPAP